jgi:hypothetical protein
VTCWRTASASASAMRHASSMLPSRTWGVNGSSAQDAKDMPRRRPSSAIVRELST